MRFFAELAWNPDALLNADGLKWRKMDDQTVEVSLETSDGLARVKLLFDGAGDIVGIAAEDRPRSVGRHNRHLVSIRHRSLGPTPIPDANASAGAAR